MRTTAFKKAIPVAVILALVTSLLSPPAPAHAISTQSWTTEADFETGVLNNVDTSTNPGAVLLTTTVDTGTGAFSDFQVYGTVNTDFRKGAITQQSNAGSNVVYVATASGSFFATDEVLIIQMIGMGAGKYETAHIQSVGSGQITLTTNLVNTYYTGDSAAQVIMIPQFQDVTVYNGAILTCDAWNGSTGGVVFFRSTGTVSINPGGRIDVSGKGLSGGNGGQGSGGSGGSGGIAGGSNFGQPQGGGGGSSGAGGGGGPPGISSDGLAGYAAGNGGLQGDAGSQQNGQTGQGAGGGAPGTGGANNSSANLSEIQTGSGGGGGNSGTGGTGAGGGGGGGSNTCLGLSQPGKGQNGQSGGSPGSGGQGGNGGGVIIICAKAIIASQQNSLVLNGSNGTSGGNGANGGQGGNGGNGAKFCVVNCPEGDCIMGGAGGGGGGGGGGNGGEGGNGAGGGAGGTLWLIADNITFTGCGATAMAGAGAAGGQGGAGGGGGSGGTGGEGDIDDGSNAYNGGNGPGGSGSPSGTTGYSGGAGKIRLDYVNLSGSTNPNPSYTSGLFVPNGTIASDVVDTGTADTPWTDLDWQETIPAKTIITFAVRASNSPFTKDDNTIPWTQVGGVSPVVKELPSGRYIQWLATLVTTNSYNSPVLHQVNVQFANAPEVATDGSTSIGETSAVLNGHIVSLLPAPSVMVSFVYGITPGSYLWETTAQPMSTTGSFQALASGLLSYTTYFYRAKAAAAGWETAYGQEMNLTTSGPPVISTNPADTITASSANLNGSVNYSPDGDMAVYFNWGTSPSNLNNQTAYQYDEMADFNQVIYGLSAGTTYYFRAVGYDDYGSYWGDMMSFTTQGIKPAVTTRNATSVTSTSATLNGTVVNFGAAGMVNVYFQYGTTQSGPYPNTTPSQSMYLPDIFTANITGLSADTTYYFRAAADGGSQGIGYGREMSFTTPGLKPLVSTDSATLITTNSCTLGGMLLDTGSASTVNVSFQYGTAHGGPYPNSTTPQPMTATGPFTANLTSLSPGTTYYYRANGDGGAQGTGYGAELNFTTPGVAPSVSTDNATASTSSTATIHGSLVSMGTASTVNVYFQYGTTHGGPYPNTTAPQARTTTGSFTANLTGLKADTTYYVMTVGNGGAQGTGYGYELNFTTPGIKPVVSTGGAASVTTNSATLNGTLVNTGSASPVNVSFQFGTSHGGPYPNTTTPQAMTAIGPFTANLTGLSANTTYYYLACGDGGAQGTGYGAEMSFTTQGIAPSVYTNNATAITASSATLNGALADPGTATTVNVYFQYGTAHGGPYSNMTSFQAMTARGPFSASVTGLSPSTTYYYRAVGNGGSQGTGYGNEASFTTSAIPPSVTTAGATAITSNSAALNGQITGMGTASTVSASFLWGTDQDNLNMETAPQTLAVPLGFNATLSGLAADTTYYFQAQANGGAAGTSYGAILSFTTSKVPPTVSTNGATGVTADSATLNGTLSSPGTAPTVDVSFQYGTASGTYSVETTPQSMSSTGDFTASASGLAAATTYYFRAKANGGIHGTSYGNEEIFTTASIPPTVTTNAISNLTTVSAMLNGNLDSLGSATTVNLSFQYGTTHGGPYTNSTATQAKTATGTFQAAVTGLTPMTTYYYRARADGGTNGTGYGAEGSFSTGMFSPYVETSPSTDQTDTSANLNGDLYLLGSASTVDVYFVYGKTHGGPYTDSTTPQTMGAPGTFQANISGLTPGTIYYFRAKGDGGKYGIYTGAEMSFSTSKLPPIIATQDASAVLSTTATLNGDLVSKGNAATVYVSFMWGTQAGGPYPYSTPAKGVMSTGVFQAALTGLQGNTAYYFRAKADGGTSGGAFGIERSFTTPMVPPSVTTENAGSITPETARLHGFLDVEGTAPTVDTWFEWGTTQGGPYPNTTPPYIMNARGKFRADITGLTPLTTYYFRAMADGGTHGSAQGSERSFTTGTTPPSVSTGGVSAVTADSATLDGTLHSLGTATTATVAFQYGTMHAAYTEETASQLLSSTGDFTANLSSLQPHTTYYYRAIANAGKYGSHYGMERTFTTGALPPTVTTAAVSHKTTDTATLNGNLDNLGSSATVTVSFQYGTTAGGPYTHSTSTQAQTATGAFTADLQSLAPFTTYYYKAKADGGLNGTAYGSEMNFTTDHLAPLVSTSGATDIVTNAGTLNGNLYQLGTASIIDASFVWGTVKGGPYPNSTPTQAKDQPGAYLADLSSLSPHTTYYFKAKGDGGTDGTSYGEEQAFTTGSFPPSIITDEASDISVSSAILNGDLRYPGSSKTVNVTFEWGTTQGGPYPYSTTAQSMTAAGSFSSALSGLNPFTAYYFRAKGDGGIYGVSYGREKSFITLLNPPSVTTVSATQISTNSALLSGALNSMGQATTIKTSFLWGTTRGGPYTGETLKVNFSQPGPFTTTLKGLAPNKTYYFIAKADGGVYGVSYGHEANFRTSSPKSTSTTDSLITTKQPKSSGGVIQPGPQQAPAALSNIIVQSASLSNISVSPGTPVEVNVVAVNKGNADGNAALKLYVNGEQEDVKAVTLRSSQTSDITFTVVRDQPGTYTIYVGGTPAGSFTVEDTIASNLLLFASMGMIMLSMLLAMIYVWKRRWQQY